MLLSEQMRERRSAKKAQLDALNATVETRDNKSYTEEETAQFDAAVAEIRSMDARIVELEAVVEQPPVQRGLPVDTARRMLAALDLSA